MYILILLVVLACALPVHAQGPVRSSDPVKKSTTGICHAPGTSYYHKTKKFVGYPTLADCLKSGGRLPKR